MSPIPAAPLLAPPSIQRGLAIAAEAWWEDPVRPRLGEEILLRWAALLNAWSDAEDLPLVVRKARDNRGHSLRHESGRTIVPSDNSPAHWALALAFNDVCPSLDEVRAMWAGDTIPIAMVMKAIERPAATYRCTRQTVEGPNAKGWKVAHIRDVGLGYTCDIERLPLRVLRDHFSRFLSPANMFLVPKAYAGVAETPEFIEIFRERVTSPNDALPGDA